MKKLFKNGWVTFGLMMLVSIADLIALPKINFGAGFVLCMIYFVMLGYYTTKNAG